MRFQAKIVPSGNATGVAVPDDVIRALGPQGSPPVTITINGHTWRSKVAAMRGQRLIGISAAHRAAARISEGDIVEIGIEIDEAPREVAEPADLANALDHCPQARASFDRLPFGLRQSTSNRSRMQSPRMFDSAVSASWSIPSKMPAASHLE